MTPTHFICFGMILLGADFIGCTLIDRKKLALKDLTNEIAKIEELREQNLSKDSENKRVVFQGRMISYEEALIKKENLRESIDFFSYYIPLSRY